MKQRLFVIVMLAAMTAGVVSCNSASPTRFKATVEALGGTKVAPSLKAGTPVALWDDNMRLQEALVELPSSEGENNIVRDDTATLTGVVRMVYPGSAVAGSAGCVAIDTVQQVLPMGEGMVYYGETTAEARDEVVMKAVSGIVCLHLTTPERLASITLSTIDSNRYMAGAFEVTNYPFPVLEATEESVRSVTLTGMADTDFAQGAEVYAYMAPGCYRTFTVQLTTTDGRVCTKNLKEGREVLVERNRVHSVILGSDEQPLVFE